MHTGTSLKSAFFYTFHFAPLKACGMSLTLKKLRHQGKSEVKYMGQCPKCLGIYRGTGNRIAAHHHTHLGEFEVSNLILKKLHSQRASARLSCKKHRIST